MSDAVKLIIDMPKEIYQDIIKNRFIYAEDNEDISNAIVNGTPLDNNSERAEVQAYFDGEAYGWEQGRKALIDDIKAEFINSYPTNYAGVPEFGGMFCHFSLCQVLEILDNISKADMRDKI